MPFNVLLSLYEQSERLADDLFFLAVEADQTDLFFDKVCHVLEKALSRLERRKKRAGL